MPDVLVNNADCWGEKKIFFFSNLGEQISTVKKKEGKKGGKEKDYEDDNLGAK